MLKRTHILPNAFDVLHKRKPHTMHNIDKGRIGMGVADMRLHMPHTLLLFKNFRQETREKILRDVPLLHDPLFTFPHPHFI
jgi:hypothetical protein